MREFIDYRYTDLPFSRKPYRITWRDPATRERRKIAFATSNERDAFAKSLAIIFAKERELIDRARRREKSLYDTRMTVSELVDAYLSGKDLRPITRKAHGHHARHFIRLFGTKRAISLTHGDLEAFTETQLLRGISRATIRLRIVIIKAAFNWGVATKRLKTSPIRDFATPRQKPRRVAPPSQDELDRMYTTAAGHVRRVILLGLYLGARIGPSELYKLKWEHVDLERGMVLMPSAAKRAGDDMRIVPVRQELLPYLAAWRAEDGDCPWVIHYRHKPVCRINHAWHKARTQAGIERRITPYMLRHAHATQALIGRADLGGVCSVMGHTSSKMVLEVYQHVDMYQLRAAVAAIGLLDCLRPKNAEQLQRVKTGDDTVTRSMAEAGA